MIGNKKLVTRITMHYTAFWCSLKREIRRDFEGKATATDRATGTRQRNGQAEDAEAFLRRLGERVRRARERRGMTRRILTKDSGVSERYLAQLESGQGNISILLLRQIARALDVPVEELVLEGEERSVELAHAQEFLKRLRPDEVVRAREILLRQFGAADASARRDRVALIGMRGAGKSTLGRMLAAERGVPFLELDRLIEKESGVGLSAIFDLYGQAAYRRLERECLEQALQDYPRFVMATGGSLVTEAATFERLRAACFTVWVAAAPEDHMKRVIEQGDMRPLTNHREAMTDLMKILAGREMFYRQADATVGTSGHTAEESLRTLRSALQESGAPKE